MHNRTYKEFLEAYGWNSEMKRMYTSLLLEAKVLKFDKDKKKLVFEAEEDEEDIRGMYGYDDLDRMTDSAEKKDRRRRKFEDDEDLDDDAAYDTDDNDDEEDPEYEADIDDKEDEEEEDSEETAEKASDSNETSISVGTASFGDPDLDEEPTKKGPDGRLIYKDDKWEKKMLDIYKNDPDKAKKERAIELLQSNKYNYLKKLVSDNYKMFPDLRRQAGFQTTEDGANTLLVRAFFDAVETFDPSKATYVVYDENGNGVRKEATFTNWLKNKVRGIIDDVVSSDRGMKSADVRHASRTVSVDETLPGSGSDGDKAQTYGDTIADERSDFSSTIENLDDDQKRSIIEFINTGLPEQEKIAFKMILQGADTQTIVNAIKDIPGESGRFARTPTALTKENGVFQRAWNKIITFCKDQGYIPEDSNPEFDFIYLKGGKSNMKNGRRQQIKKTYSKPEEADTQDASEEDEEVNLDEIE